MQDNNSERWRELCEQAAVEQDSPKLMQLVTEINQMLLEKEKRLQEQRQEAEKNVA